MEKSLKDQTKTQYKIVVLGESKVGKTTFLQTYN